MNNGGGDSRNGGTGSPPPSTITTVHFKTNDWVSVMKMLGIQVEVIDKNKDGVIDANEQKQAGIDLKDGLSLAEAKKLKSDINEAFFGVVDSDGGHGIVGNGSITWEDANRFNEDVINRLAQGCNKREKVIAEYLAARSFKLSDPDQAAAKFNEQKKNMPGLYAADGQINANVLLKNCINPALQGAATAVLTNITGKPVDDSLLLTPDQFKTFLLAMNFLGKADNPKNFLNSAEGMPKLKDNDLLAWLTAGSTNAIPPEVKAGRAEGNEKSGADDANSAESIQNGINAIADKVGNDGPEALQARVDKLDDYEKKIDNVKNDGHKNILRDLVERKRRALAQAFMNNSNPRTKAIGLGLLRKLLEKDPTNEELKQHYLKALQGVFGTDLKELGKPEYAGMVKELELAVSETGVFGKPTDTDSAKIYTIIVLKIAKIRNARENDPTAAQKYIDEKLGPIWDASFWVGHEGDKALLAYEAAKTKSALFISKKDSGEYAIASGANTDRELEIVANNWTAKVGEGKETVGEQVSKEITMINERSKENKLTPDDATAVYTLNAFYSAKADKIKDKIENKDDKEIIDTQRKRAKEINDKVFSADGNKQDQGKSKKRTGRAGNPGGHSPSAPQGPAQPPKPPAARPNAAKPNTAPAEAGDSGDAGSDAPKMAYAQKDGVLRVNGTIVARKNEKGTSWQWDDNGISATGLDPAKVKGGTPAPAK
ncbi:MAG: hypothetical protein WC624_01290 [Candidatus Margulisiibacteriota bacterium]